MSITTYTGTEADNAREWKLIHARDAHLALLAEQGRERACSAIQQARTTCAACEKETPVAVRCHACGDWLNEAAAADFDTARAAVVARDARIAAEAEAATIGGQA